MNDQMPKPISEPPVVLADALPGVTYRLTLLPQATVSYVSKSVATLLSIAPEELLFKPTEYYQQFLAADDQHIIQHKIEIARQSRRLEKTHLHTDYMPEST